MLPYWIFFRIPWMFCRCHTSARSGLFWKTRMQLSCFQGWIIWHTTLWQRSHICSLSRSRIWLHQRYVFCLYIATLALVYWQAKSFVCISVLSPSPAECESRPSVHVPGGNGYISSYVARKSGCGNMDHPWIIEVQPGQRVNVSMVNFDNGNHKHSAKCKPLG